MGYVYTALLVNLSYLNFQLIANVDNIFNLLNALLVKLGNVARPFLAWQELYKSAKIHSAGNLALVELTYLNFLDDIR